MESIGIIATVTFACFIALYAIQQQDEHYEGKLKGFLMLVLYSFGVNLIQRIIEVYLF